MDKISRIIFAAKYKNQAKLDRFENFDINFSVIFGSSYQMFVILGATGY